MVSDIICRHYRMMYFENIENNSENRCFNTAVLKSDSLKSQESVLLCANFQESLHVEFGKVSLKGSKTIHFSLKNPSINKSVVISTSHNSKSGLAVSIDNAVDNSVTILPLQSNNVSLTWSPMSDSTLREIIRFKMDDKGSLQVIAEGIAGSGKVCFSVFLVAFSKLTDVDRTSEETSKPRKRVH